MASRSPASNKRRPPLATLPHASQGTQRRSSLAKLSSLDIPLNEASESPAVKKPRRSASKRVSFGGEHIKLFNHEHEADWEESPPFQAALTGSALQPSPVRPSRSQSSPSPSPRRSPRFVKSPVPASTLGQDAMGDDGDTLTLPHAAGMVHEQASTPQRVSTSALFMDEDVTPGAAARRISVPGEFGDDTTVIVPIPAPARGVNMAIAEGGGCHRRESLQSNLSDGDITQQIPRMNGLLDVDEAYDGVDTHGLRSPRGDSGMVSPFASVDEVTRSMGDDDNSVGDVTAQAATVAALLAEEEELDASNAHGLNSKDEVGEHSAGENGLSPSCPSPGASRRVSIGDITLGMPSVGALLSLDEPNTPEEEVLKPSAPQEKQKSTVSARPVLPESRQLFATELQGDDTTIHYHDPAGRGTDGAEEVSNPTTEAQTASETSAMDAGAAVMVGGRAQLQCETENVTAYSIGSAPDGEFSHPPREGMLDTSGGQRDVQVIAEFLEAVNVQFRDVDFNSLQRGASLGYGLGEGPSDGEGDDNVGDAKQSTEFKRVHSAIRSAAVLKLLNQSVKDMQDELATRQQRVAELSEVISRDPPKYFERAADSEKMKQSELSKMQLEFKRLRKASLMQARREHARIRIEREQRITAAEYSQILTLDTDKGVLCTTADLLNSEAAKIDAAVAESGLQDFVDQVAGSETDFTVTRTLRSEVTSHVAALEKAREAIQAATASKESMASESLVLENGNEELKQETDRLREYALVSSRDDLMKLVEQHRDEHLLLSTMTGIYALALSESEVHVRLVGLLDVRFGLQGNAVTIVNCSFDGENKLIHGDSHFGKFVTHAATLVCDNYLKRVGIANDIPLVLQKCVAFLMQVLKVDLGLAQYRAVHEVSYEPAGSPGASSPAAEMTVRAEYYSLSRHCKFDVTMSLLAIAPDWKVAGAHGSSSIDARVDVVNPIIGECPAKDNICDAVEACTAKGLHFPLSDALESVWKLLE